MKPFSLFPRTGFLIFIVCFGLLFRAVLCLREQSSVPNPVVQSQAPARSLPLYSRDHSFVARKLAHFKNINVEPVRLTCPHDTFLPFIHPTTGAPLWFSRDQFDTRGNNLTNWCIRYLCLCNYDNLSHRYKLECLSRERYAMLSWCEITCRCEAHDLLHHRRDEIDVSATPDHAIANLHSPLANLQSRVHYRRKELLPPQRSAPKNS